MLGSSPAAAPVVGVMDSIIGRATGGQYGGGGTKFANPSEAQRATILPSQPGTNPTLRRAGQSPTIIGDSYSGKTLG